MTKKQFRPPRIYAKAQTAQAATGKSWFNIAAKDENDVKSINVMIYDEIGYWGITAAEFIKAFNAIDDGVSPVSVYINSIGGDVFDGFALNGFLNRLGNRCTAHIDGIAASIASVVAVGAAKVIIGGSAMMMIHNPWTFAAGSSEELRKIADDMDKVRDSILAAYRRKAPDIDEAELIKMLDDETWLSAEEAVALGLADVIADGPGIKASLGRTGIFASFKRPPKAMMQDDEVAPSGNPEPAADPATAVIPDPAITARHSAKLTQALVDGGFQNLVETILNKTDLTDEAAVAAETQRIQNIRELCIMAKLPELAADYVNSGISAESARSRLFDKIVAAGAGDIDNKEPELTAGTSGAKAQAPNPTTVYAKRKSPTARAAQSKSTKGVTP